MRIAGSHAGFLAGVVGLCRVYVFLSRWLSPAPSSWFSSHGHEFLLLPSPEEPFSSISELGKPTLTLF